MAKPKVFLSSTCYDLSIVRAELDNFLEGYCFEVLNTEKPSFGVTPQKHSHSACLEGVKLAEYVIVIIGGTRGGTFIGSEKSITNEEYNLAKKLGIPTIIFVDKKIMSTIPTFKKNPTADFTHIVDDIRIFDFVEYINASSEDNWIFTYENIEDIKETLRAQFSFYLYLYAQSLKKNVEREKQKDYAKLSYVKFPPNLDLLKSKKLDQQEETCLINGLKALHRTLTKILSSEEKKDNKLEKLKCIWVIGKYGTEQGNFIEINNDIFKGYAWSTSRGNRVFNQMQPYGILGEYDETNGLDMPQLVIRLRFKEEDVDVAVVYALTDYINTLLDKYDNDSAYDLFLKCDMRVYMT